MLAEDVTLQNPLDGARMPDAALFRLKKLAAIIAAARAVRVIVP